MPYCPKCRDEFQDWVKVCPDCGVALVKELPSELEKINSNEPLVHIATAPNEPIANMWSDILADNGIRCLLKSGHLKAIGISVGPIAIHVLASQAERAKEILAPLMED